jgi:hypothetical protein
MEQETEAPPVPTEKLVKAYIKMRDARAALAKKYEDDDKAIKDQMEIIERMLMDVCKKAGADSIRTTAGTVIRSVKTSYWTSDWESMHNFIKENQALDLLERRIAQRAMKDWLEANPDKMPKGLNTESKYTVTVRRS